MKYLFLVVLAAICMATCLGLAQADEASLAWFTDASITSSSKTAKPAGAPPDAPGTILNGVLLNTSAGIDNPQLKQQHGMISFWIKPNWNGNDGLNHRFLRIGDAAVNGFIVEKSAQGMLRFVMAGGGKITASRCDVSSWQAGKWHQVVCSWVDMNSKPLGLCLWVDKTCMDSSIWGGTAFMNPTIMSDKKLYIGDAATNATMDELICRGAVTGSYGPGQIDMIYRDYFRTAPYTAIKIDGQPHRVKTDTRVVKNAVKQFGLMALMEGEWVRITDFAVRYGNWGTFDAKPFITWNTSSASIATVDSYSGRVTGVGIGHCNLTATFRGMTTDPYDIEVISRDQPDIDLMYVERNQKYSKHSSKKWPSDGEIVHSVAHVSNYGFTNLPAGTLVKFELVPDVNQNFVCDADEEPTITQYATINQVLTPRQSTTVSFDWAWTMTPTFVRVTVDPANAVSEICEANNQRCELNVARAFRWGYVTSQFDNDYNNKNINLVGSYSDYDWCTAEVDRMALVMRDAVYDTTSPVGMHDSLRVDNFYQRLYFGDDSHWNDEPYMIDDELYDGGFPNMEPQNSTVMDIDAAIGHEIGHTTLGLPDLYGHPHRLWNVFLKDQAGQSYAGTSVYPEVSPSDPNIAPFTTATFDNTDQLGVGYAPLMVYCHLWLHPANAGFSNHYAQQRKGLVETDQDFGYLVPSGDNRLKVYDINDQPLKGAAVYMYQMVLTMLATADSKYLPDRPKFIGNTDDNGYFVIPKNADPSWDDWDTDAVDGAISCWNPFHRVNSEAWGPSWTNGEYFVIKIVSGDKVEFRTLPLTELNEAYFRGDVDGATYPIKTNLTSVTGGTAVVPPVIPDAIKTVNLKPVAVVPSEIYVGRGQTFTIDASKSYDPEGQPLYYRWYSPVFSTNSILQATASSQTGDYIYQLTVIDGLRSTNVEIIVHVMPNTTVSGRVTDSASRGVSGAIVGFKSSTTATADASYYAVTDANGYYSATYVGPGTWYVAAWKDGMTPSADSSVVMTADTPKTVNLQLTRVADRNVILTIPTVSASNQAAGTAYSAVDGNLSTMWRTKTYPVDPSYYYIDLIHPTSISDIVLYRYKDNSVQDTYQIDVMTSGDPLTPSSWDGNATVQTVYTAASSKHGYQILGQVGVDPIRLSLTGIRGIRVKFSSYSSPANFDIYEVQVHGSNDILPMTVTGRVVGPGGSPIAGALVGCKSTEKATGDADTYLVTDQTGHYSKPGFTFVPYRFAAWKDGYCASDDTVATLSTSSSTVPDILLSEAGVNKILKTSRVAATSSATGTTPFKAVDGSLLSFWQSPLSPSSTQYYYIDLQTPSSVTDMVIYRYLERNSSGDSRDDYQIDVMTSATANPLNAVYWTNPANGISTVYSATNTIHGYEIAPGVAVDPLYLGLTGIRGIRIKFTNYHSPKCYDIKEIQLHQPATFSMLGGVFDLKNANTGDYVAIGGQVLTALPGNGIPASVAYAEEPDRSAGIRLDLTAFPDHTATIGSRLNIRGLVGLTYDKEKFIQVTRWDYTPGEPLDPMFLTLPTLGGGMLNKQEGVWNQKSGVPAQSSGLNNIGLFVKVCGRVTSIDSSGQYFYIDDGSGLLDGTKIGTVPNVGVKITADGRSYTKGTFLTVTGISSCFNWGDGKLLRLVRPIAIN